MAYSLIAVNRTLTFRIKYDNILLSVRFERKKEDVV